MDSPPLDTRQTYEDPYPVSEDGIHLQIDRNVFVYVTHKTKERMTDLGLFNTIKTGIYRES